MKPMGASGKEAGKGNPEKVGEEEKREGKAGIERNKRGKKSKTPVQRVNTY